MTATIPEPARIDAVAEALADAGRCVLKGFLPPVVVASLRDDLRALQAAGALRPAGIGRGEERQVRSEVRGDFIHWLAPPCTPAQHQYLALMEELRLAMNRRLFLGLFDLECHFAAYPAGSFYARHVDRFRDDSRRTVSCIVYLNERWRAEDGGALRLYAGAGPEAAFEDVLPAGGTLACFLSDSACHEVLPATRERLSLTGWFRVRA